MTAPVSAHVVESATAVTPAGLISGQGTLTAQPVTSADNIVWGTSSNDDGGRGAFSDDANIVWQSSVDDGDSTSGTSLHPPSF
jgi:hypothetical protein